MAQYGVYPAGGGGSGSGVPTYPNTAAFPAVASDGALAIALDTHSLYEYNATAVQWQLLGTANQTVTSVGTIDSKPKSSDGASIVQNALFMQTADGTNPGLVSTAAQTFAGVKTFSSAPVLSSLTTGIAHVGSGGAITSSSIVDADVASAAAIAVSKLAPLTTSRAVVTDGSGFISAATTTAAEIGFVNGVTSSIQTQLNGKQASGNYVTALTGDVTATGPGSVVATLATVNSNVGSFGSSTSIPSFTVNAKGLITAASGNVVIAPAGTLSGTTLNSTVVTSSLTTVGTIATGVWQGTAVDATHGGTAQTSWTLGDILYSSATNTLSKLAGNTSSTLKVFTQTGTGTVSAAPAWSTVTVTHTLLTSGSGTYNVPAGCKQIYVRMIGAGGGGGPSGTGANVDGGTGGSTTFGTNSAGGGPGGASSNATTFASGPVGGSNTTTLGTIIMSLVGSGGNSGSAGGTTPTANGTSGTGGAGPWGGAGGSVKGSTNGRAGTAWGAGGAGGGGTATVFPGPGGAAGSYIEFFITAPLSSYSYAIGAAGTAGTGGQNGGAGFSGAIFIDEYYF
jgi:hypothetical protein